jgi:hypothetical protein
MHAKVDYKVSQEHFVATHVHDENVVNSVRYMLVYMLVYVRL